MKVRSNKRTGQKSVTIPKECKEIKGGDYVQIVKLDTNKKGGKRGK